LIFTSKSYYITLLRNSQCISTLTFFQLYHTAHIWT